MKKYDSIRVVTAKNRHDAIDKLVLTVEELYEFLKVNDHENEI